MASLETIAAIRQEIPWLPDELIGLYADEFESSGDPARAWGAVRQSGLYGEFFPGNRRADGTLRFSEAEYLATVDARRAELAGYGLNADTFSDQIVASIEGDQSTAEFRERLALAYTEVVGGLDGVADQFAASNGLVADTATIFGMFIDPGLELAVLNRQIDVAQISAAASRSDLVLQRPEADRLAAFGVTEAQAIDLFGSAAQVLPTLNELARRHRDPDDTFDINEFLEAQVFSDPAQNARINRLAAAEAALFSPSQALRRGRGSGISGLRPV